MYPQLVPCNSDAILSRREESPADFFQDFTLFVFKAEPSVVTRYPKESAINAEPPQVVNHNPGLLALKVRCQVRTEVKNFTGENGEVFRKELMHLGSLLGHVPVNGVDANHKLNLHAVAVFRDVHRVADGGIHIVV